VNPLAPEELVRLAREGEEIYHDNPLAVRPRLLATVAHFQRELERVQAERDKLAKDVTDFAAQRSEDLAEIMRLRARLGEARRLPDQWDHQASVREANLGISPASYAAGLRDAASVLRAFLAQEETL
jgi:hypothetical protein